MYTSGMQQQAGAFSDQSRQEAEVFDGKRMRRSIVRKYVDISTPIIRMIETRCYERNYFDSAPVQHQPRFQRDVLPPTAMRHVPASNFMSHFCHQSTNKNRCPINALAWAPDGRRVITGASTGEFTLWNGYAFNFETILQAHETAVRAMKWSHNGVWMVSGDHSGTLKYWQTNMNMCKEYVAHREAIRDISFAPSDVKFATASDDVTIKIWDFVRCEEEQTLSGHGWDVKSVHWHPWRAMLASGAKDNVVKLWDAKSGANVATLHGHKNTVMQVRWNANGNWLLTASRDQQLRLYDVRTLRELNVYRGHRKEVSSITWHPQAEQIFCSGGFDGSIYFWDAYVDAPVAEITSAHEGGIWGLEFHPAGHVLASASADQTTKFFCRNRPGLDRMDDTYNNNGQGNEGLPVFLESAAVDDILDYQETYDDILSAPAGGDEQQQQQAYYGGGALPGLEDE